MSEEKNFDQMIDETIRTIRTGEIVEGTVLYVKPEYIALNIHYKYDGIITKEEYSYNQDIDLTTAVSVGDVIEAKVLKIQDNEVQLSYKRINDEKINKRVEEACENKEVINVKVEKVTTGGLITSFEGASIFVPASLVSDRFEKDLEKYLGQNFDIIITEFNPKKKRVIGNRKTLLVAERKAKEKELLESLQIGDIIEGEIKSVTAFGAFVDLGGIDGLLHISEMSWGHVDSPKSVFKAGDKVRVYVKNIEGKKIALSARFPGEDPWALAEEKYQPGTIVKGKVARMADFGAFIELEPGIDALLHVSQISKKHVKKPSDVLKLGQEIDAKVVNFKIIPADPEKEGSREEKKISLSRRDFEDDIVPEDYNPKADEPAKEEAPVEEAAPAEAPAVEEAPAEEAASAEEAPAAE